MPQKQMKDACRGEGVKGVVSKKRNRGANFKKKGNAWCQIRSAKGGGCFPHSEKKEKMICTQK